MNLMVFRKAKKIIVTMLAICMSLIIVACSSSNNDKKKLNKKADRYVGVFITYGIKESNTNQEKLKKEEKIYGELKYNKDESLRLEFRDIEGVVASAYIEDVDEEGYVDSILGDELLDVNIEIDSKNIKFTDYVLKADMKIHESIEDDVIVYFNPIYMDKEGMLYVTAKKSVKEIIKKHSEEKKEDIKVTYVLDESTFYADEYEDAKISVRLDIDYASKEESKYSNKEDILIREVEYKKDDRLGEAGDLYDNDAFQNLDEEYDCKECISQVKDYDAYDTVVGYIDNVFKLAPYNYDGDVEYYNEYVEEVKCTKDAVFFDMTITNIEKVDNNKYTHDCSFTEITKQEVVDILKDSDVSALVWFNDKKEITKMVLYGTTTVTE